MVARSLPPMYARLGERELAVRWAWFRPEVQIGDTVRLPTDSSGVAGWQSFRVTGKQLRLDVASGQGADAGGAGTVQAIHLDVEPIALME